MIRINLLGEKVDKSGIYLLQLLAFGASTFVILIACFFVQSGVSDTLQTAQQEQGLLQTKLARLRKETKKVEKLEEKKELLREKLTTIALLKAKKHGPVRVLDDLNSALPERAWIDGVKEKGGFLELSGVALDNPTIAKFMRNLEASMFFGDVDLIHSTLQIIDDVKLKRFKISVKLEDQLEIKKKVAEEAARKAAEQSASETEATKTKAEAA